MEYLHKIGSIVVWIPFPFGKFGGPDNVALRAIDLFFLSRAAVPSGVRKLPPSALDGLGDSGGDFGPATSPGSDTIDSAGLIVRGLLGVLERGLFGWLWLCPFNPLLAMRPMTWSLAHLWQTLCWHGNKRGVVK